MDNVIPVVSRDGILWTSPTEYLDCYQADLLAAKFGYGCAEQLCKALEGYQEICNRFPKFLGVTDKCNHYPPGHKATYFVLRLDMTADCPAHIRACRLAMFEYIAAMRADTRDEGGEAHDLDRLHELLEALEKQDAGPRPSTTAN